MDFSLKDAASIGIIGLLVAPYQFMCLLCSNLNILQSYSSGSVLMHGAGANYLTTDREMAKAAGY